MQYHRARKLIKTGDVIVAAGNWNMSRAIRLFTRSRVSHVGIAVWLQFNDHAPRLCMLEAMEGREIRILFLYKTLNRLYWPNGGKVWWKSINKLDICGEEIAAYCIDRVGDSYADRYQFVVAISPMIKRIR